MKNYVKIMHQITLELVDIWHFGLSLSLIERESLDESASILHRHLSNPLPSREFCLDIEDFAANTLETKRFDAKRFGRLMSALTDSEEGGPYRLPGKGSYGRSRRWYANGGLGGATPRGAPDGGAAAVS